MTLPIDTKFLPVRILLCAFWTILCILVIGAPILASQEYLAPSSIIYLAFSGVCHQIPERSFIFAGFPFAVCHRCLGIYVGLLAGSLVKNRLVCRPSGIRRCWIFASIAPLILDVLLPFTGIVDSTPLSRFLTGLLFGTMLSSLFLHGIRELLNKTPSQRLYSKGGIK